jgi:hypothetical protein
MGLEKDGSCSSDGRACLSRRTVVQADPMRESGPGERVDLQDVVQELDQLVGSRADLLDRVGLLDGVEIVPHMVDAAAGRCHDVVEAGEVAHEQRLGLGGLRVEPAVCHRLAAACLVAGVLDVVAEPLQELECRNADVWEECVDVAGNKKSDSHASLLGVPWI